MAHAENQAADYTKLHRNAIGLVDATQEVIHRNSRFAHEMLMVVQTQGCEIQPNI